MGTRRHAKARPHTDRLDLDLRSREAEPFGKQSGMLKVDFRNDYGEFLAANTRNQIHFTTFLAKRVSESAQYAVAERMSGLIIDPFEMIDVGHDQGQGTAISMNAAPKASDDRGGGSRIAIGILPSASSTQMLTEANTI